MFRPSASSPAAASSYSNSTNNNQSLSSSSAFLFDGNTLFLPSYFASSSPHLKEVNDSSDSMDMQGHEVGTCTAGGRANRYSPEERKERIERYRSKRNLRNFQKKITYECRKTLADSRPRVRGRFAKNGETESETDTADSSNGSYYSHPNSMQDTSSNANADAWWQVEAELMAADTFEAESESYYDDELWAQLVSDFSANI